MSTMRVMRAGKRALAMIAVTFAFASSVAYVIPNAQAVEPASVQALRTQISPQTPVSVASDVVPATVSRDGYGVTLPPPPPPPPPVVVKSKVAGATTFALVPSSSSAELQWPVPAGTKVLSPFGPRSCSGCSSYHEGVDLGAPGGAPIWAMASGVVIETNSAGSSSYGVHVTLQHNIDGQIVNTLYAHMVVGSMTLKVGDVVTAGQALGAVGCTGSCTGTHLHFEIHPGGGAAVDPMAWLSARLG